MPGPDVEYYRAVAEFMLPFLRGRSVVVEQRFPHSNAPIYRRHAGKDRSAWIAIKSTADIIDWARKYTIGFHADLRANGPGCWFVLDIDARERPLAMAQLAALHALDVLNEAELAPLIKFSGANGFHLMWEIPSLRGLGRGSIWEVERAAVRALARQVAARLAQDERAAPLRDAVGSGPLVVTNSQDEAHLDALLFDENILKPNVNLRVPYSLHAGSGLVSLPLAAGDLGRFAPPQAQPELVRANAVAVNLPRLDLADLRRALVRWE